MPQKSRTAVALLAIATAAFAAGCSGRSASPSSAPSTAPTFAPATTAPPGPPAGPDRIRPPATTRPPQLPTDRAPTAADSLAAFFAAAEADDARIRATARSLNGGIGPTSVHFSRSTLDAVKASRPTRTARAIPAGMDADLQRAAMVVYNDLTTRSAAFNPVWELGTESRSRTDITVVNFLDALRYGSVVARAFPADLAAARALAAARRPFESSRPGSRAAAEVAIRVALIDTANSGCGSSGSPVRRDLAPVVWKTAVAPHGRYDGSVRGILFTASYASGTGWTITLNAC